MVSPKALTTCVWVHFPGLLSPPAVTLSRSAPCLVSTVFFGQVDDRTYIANIRNAAVDIDTAQLVYVMPMEG